MLPLVSCQQRWWGSKMRGQRSRAGLPIPCLHMGAGLWIPDTPPGMEPGSLLFTWHLNQDQSQPAGAGKRHGPPSWHSCKVLVSLPLRGLPFCLISFPHTWSSGRTGSEPSAASPRTLPIRLPFMTVMRMLVSRSVTSPLGSRWAVFRLLGYFLKKYLESVFQEINFVISKLLPYFDFYNKYV